MQLIKNIRAAIIMTVPALDTCPLQHYIKLEDYSGGLRYLNWFDKNFPDDGCYAEFLLEWSVILFKTGRFKEAEKKVFETYCENTYIFDKLFSRPIIEIDKWESSLMESKIMQLTILHIQAMRSIWLTTCYG